MPIVANTFWCLLLNVYPSIIDYKTLKSVIHEKLNALGGTGGVIVLDQNGNYAMTFNTAGMYRGVIDDQGVSSVLIYGGKNE